MAGASLSCPLAPSPSALPSPSPSPHPSLFNLPHLLPAPFPALKASLHSCFLGSSSPLRASSPLKHFVKAHPAPGHARADAFKVALLGAARGVGPPLSLLIKNSPLVSHLHLHDTVNVEGVVDELSHSDSPAQVIGFAGPSQLANSLKDVDIVVIATGLGRRPDMTPDELFNINAGTVKSIIDAIAENCPKAWIHIVTDPVNSLVPMAANALRKYKVFNPAKLFGVTTLDVVRANALVAQKKNLKLSDVDVPVVGGHSGVTILPLLSRTKPSCDFSQEEIEELTDQIQNGAIEDFESAMADAAAKFLDSCLRALDGEEDIFEFAFVQSAITQVSYFASRMKLCKEGVQFVVGKDFIGMTKFEEAALKTLIPDLRESIEIGLAFVQPEPAVV